MEVVIYHCRGRDKFVPLGYASTVFTITGGCVLYALSFLKFFFPFSKSVNVSTCFSVIRSGSVPDFTFSSQRCQPERPELHPEPSHRLRRHTPRSQPVPEQRRHQLQLGLRRQQWDAHLQRAHRHTHLPLSGNLQTSGGPDGEHSQLLSEPHSWYEL